MTLHVYFARRFLFSFLAVFGVFALFCLFAELTNQFLWFGGKTDLSTIAILAALNTPQTVDTILPLIMVFASVLLFLTLARGSELVVARASGRSGSAFLLGPISVVVLISVALLTIVNPIVSYATNEYTALSNSLKNNGRSAVSLSREGMWLRQADENGHAVIWAKSSNSDGSIFFNTTFYLFSDTGLAERQITAETARIGPNGWTLYRAKIWRIGEDAPPEKNTELKNKLTLKSTLTQDQIQDRFQKRATISLWNLPATIETLKAAGFSAKRHEVWLHSEFSRPLFLIAMLFLGAAFSMKHSRFVGTGRALLGAVLFGFGFFYLRNFSQVLGETGQLPILIAVWTPPIACLLLSVSMLLFAEDG